MNEILETVSQCRIKEAMVAKIIDPEAFVQTNLLDAPMWEQNFVNEAYQMKQERAMEKAKKIIAILQEETR